MNNKMTAAPIRVMVFEYLGKLSGALMESEELVDFRLIETQEGPGPGEILLGRILQTNPSLQGAFVEIGDGKPAFMPLEKEELPQYKSGQELPVEVKKASVGQKGCTVSACFSLKTDHVVLSYGKPYIGVSQKITDPKERKRLREAAEAFEKRETVGYVIRTESEGIEAFRLQKEASQLAAVYDRICQKARYSPVGSKLYQSGSQLLEYLRAVPLYRTQEIVFAGDLPTDKFMEEMSLSDPERLAKVRIFEENDKKASQHLQEVFRIPSQLQEALNKRVWLDNGGYLFIEQTEALCAIDVNTGKLSGSHEEKQAAIEAFNLAAVPKIAQQIRLRELSGILLIDFVDMESEEARQSVLKALRRAFDDDMRKTVIYGFTKLQLLEIARERKDRPLAARIGV